MKKKNDGNTRIDGRRIQRIRLRVHIKTLSSFNKRVVNYYYYAFAKPPPPHREHTLSGKIFKNCTTKTFACARSRSSERQHHQQQQKQQQPQSSNSSSRVRREDHKIRAKAGALSLLLRLLRILLPLIKKVERKASSFRRFCRAVVV
jgi:hypothetical protein